jgi:CheY-like chemotaxis protein
MATILIIDDTAILAELIASMLSTAGYQARCTAGAREALELAHAQRPDLVLLDPRSEGGGGMRFLRALRADAKLAAIPVVVLTGASDRAILLEVAKLGVRHYLLKSKASVKELLDRVGQCIRAEPPTVLPSSARAEPTKVASPAKARKTPGK